MAKTGLSSRRKSKTFRFSQGSPESQKVEHNQCISLCRLSLSGSRRSRAVFEFQAQSRHILQLDKAKQGRFLEFKTVSKCLNDLSASESLHCHSRTSGFCVEVVLAETASCQLVLTDPQSQSHRRFTRGEEGSWGDGAGEGCKGRFKWSEISSLLPSRLLSASFSICSVSL